MEDDVAEQLSTVTENLPESPDLFSGKCLSEYFCLPDKIWYIFIDFRPCSNSPYASAKIIQLISPSMTKNKKSGYTTISGQYKT